MSWARRAPREDRNTRRTVLHLAEFSPHAAGSFVDHIEALAEALRARGWSMALGLPVSIAPRHWHERIHRVGCRLFLLRRPWGALGPGFVSDLAAVIREVRPPIVHLRFSASSIAPVTLLAPGAVRILQWHGPPAASGHALSGLHALTRPHHLAVSAALAEDLTRVLPPSADVRYLPNAVLLPEICTPPEGEDLLAIQAFRPQKDAATLLAALTHLVSLGWRGRLRWIGSGPEQEAAVSEARRLGLLERIEFLGNVEPVAPYLRSSALLVLATHYEGQPFAVLEAMAHGRPVVATDLPVCREILGPDAGDLLVPPREPVALARAVHRLLGSDERRTAVSRMLRARAVENHSLERWTATLGDWYSEWLGRKRRNHSRAARPVP